MPLTPASEAQTGCPQAATFGLVSLNQAAGRDPPLTITFADLGVPNALCQTLAQQGIDAPFAIQELTIAAALSTVPSLTLKVKLSLVAVSDVLV